MCPSPSALPHTGLSLSSFEDLFYDAPARCGDTLPMKSDVRPAKGGISFLLPAFAHWHQSGDDEHLTSSWDTSLCSSDSSLLSSPERSISSEFDSASGFWGWNSPVGSHDPSSHLGTSTNLTSSSLLETKLPWDIKSPSSRPPTQYNLSPMFTPSSLPLSNLSPLTHDSSSSSSSQHLTTIGATAGPINTLGLSGIPASKLVSTTKLSSSSSSRSSTQRRPRSSRSTKDVLLSPSACSPSPSAAFAKLTLSNSRNPFTRR